VPAGGAGDGLLLLALVTRGGGLRKESASRAGDVDRLLMRDSVGNGRRQAGGRGDPCWGAQIAIC